MVSCNRKRSGFWVCMLSDDLQYTLNSKFIIVASLMHMGLPRMHVHKKGAWLC